MRVNASSSSEPNLLEIDLLATGRLPKIPSAWLRGEHQDLLEPLHFLMPGDRPTGPAPEVDREALAAALATANSGYGHPAAAEKARLLADPATRVVVTGQQPGLWGGPLLSLNKMIAAQRWAEELTEIDARWMEIAKQVDTLAVGLEKTDVKVTQISLAWMPA